MRIKVRTLARPLALALIVLAALWLRTDDLAARPMHADEANQAVKTGDLLETGRYAFDPRDHHGPTLYYATLPIAWIRGQRSLAALDETTLRLVPAIAGTLGVLLLGAFCATVTAPRNATGEHAPARASAATLVPLAAAAFLAVSPPAVYYSRYYIQETLLATFTLAAWWCAAVWWRQGSSGWAIAMGAFLGLMQATKASAPLFAVAALIAVLIGRPGRPATAHLVRDAVLALAAALLIAAVFYSSFGTHPAGLRDAVATYFPASDRAIAGAGHEKPWFYYLQFFGWQRAGGLVWHQLPFAALAVCGAGLALRLRVSQTHRTASEARLLPQRRLLLGALCYTAVILAVLSATPYKTPWHLIHFVPGLAVLAAGGLHFLHAPGRQFGVSAGDGADAGEQAVQRFRRRISGIVAGLIALAVLQTLHTQARLAAFLRPADVRNPYAYVHSAPDVRKVRALAETALASGPDAIVRVISEEYWPLPWYLRGLDRVGYWPTAPETCDASLIVSSETQADAVRARLNGNYRESYLGLRPGFLCVVFTPDP